jgi:hypothetical protein
MQHLEDSGTPVLYIGRTVLKGFSNTSVTGHRQRVVDFPQRKSLRRSTDNSSKGIFISLTIRSLLHRIGYIFRYTTCNEIS